MDRKEMLEKLKPVALELAIQKWQDIVEGKGENLAENNCALCLLFAKDDCEGCPVKEAIGKKGCERTPYGDFVDADYRDDETAKKKIARKEVEFLKSLRKKEA